MTVVLDRGSIRRGRWHNLLQAALLLGASSMILIGCLWLLAGELALLAAGVALLVGIATMMRLSPHQVMRWHKALPLTPGQLPELEWAVAELARRAGLPACPALYWLPVPEINAVSAGSAEDSAIAVSDGAFRTLDRREMVGVLAHEIAHIAAGDTRLLALVDLLSRLTRSFALLGLLVCLVALLTLPDDNELPVWMIVLFGTATPLALLVQMALSRNREYAADLTAIQLAGDAVGLASALQKIDGCRQRYRMFGLAPTTETPVWLRSHPPTAGRVIRILRQVRVVPEPSPLISLLRGSGWHPGFGSG